MAGGIFSNVGNLFEEDCSNLHPLVCHLCHEQYKSPCLLDCYHIFCARCLRGRTNDCCLSCPLCYNSMIKGNNALPPEDRLLKFLVDNNADVEETALCANCDQESNKDTGLMYYCNTCNQPLCATCRELTHKARMFSHHEIVSLAKRTKAKHRKCLHEEPYILFSTENKSMLCIKCFRDMQESRTHCIDIETAYAQGCEMLDQAVLVVKELQTSTGEAIHLLRAMIGEVHLNVEEEESAICSLFNSLQERLAERKKTLLKAAQSLQTEIQNLKDQVQELHRDLTKHHSIINTDKMGEILDRSLHIDNQIAAQYSTVDTMRVMFEEIWDETLQMVNNEQEIYEQLHDLMQLKQENSYLTTIARQISPYIMSIAKVKERLEPFQEPKEHLDDRTETMLKIYEDSTVPKDSQD
uniref:RING finger protein 207 n=1 Tax=Cyprinodon variegatus TaxID=28743 RepID=A0A3Q2FYT2_CYPVA